MACPSAEELNALYHIAKMSTPDIAKHYGVSKGTVYNWFRKCGISTRSNGEGVTLAQTGKTHTEGHKAAISRAHKGKKSPHMAGRNNPIFKHSAEGVGWAKGGYREDIGIYVRSRWEANYCRYLGWLMDQGEIQAWEYEPDTFIFHGETRGAIHYTPDFKVTERDGTVVYHEIKGWMDSKSRTKLKRMRKHYPDVMIVVIGEDEYKAISKWKGLIPEWE